METEPAPTPNDEEKNFLGVPYDLRPPTVARLKSRWWNPADRRLLTPKTFGWDTTSTCTGSSTRCSS